MNKSKSKYYRRLTKLRGQQSAERERIRRDYDLLSQQLDELSKREMIAKMNAQVSVVD